MMEKKQVLPEKIIGLKSATKADILRLEGLEEPPESITGIPFDKYLDTVVKFRERAKMIGGETLTNYFPLDFSVLLRAEASVSKSILMTKNFKKIMESGKFIFTVVGYGPTVKSLRLFDIVDIKNTQELSFRPFIPHNNAVGQWLDLLEGNKDFAIATQVSGAEDASKVGAQAVKDIQESAFEMDKEGFVQIGREDNITIIEHAIVEIHNLNSIYEPFRGVYGRER